MHSRTLLWGLAVFLLLGLTSAILGLILGFNGMAGNLVAEASGVFFGAAVVDGAILFLQRAEADLQRKEEERRLKAIEAVHARALGLTLSHDKHLVRLWGSNRGTHHIQEIEINAIPDAEDWQEFTHGSLPKLQPSGVPGVAVEYPFAGSWFFAKVDQLNPGHGLMIVISELEEGDFTMIDFDVSWNDHEGKQRKSHTVVDVGSARGEVPLEPRGTITSNYSFTRPDAI
jgi:hypothetical protein